MSAPGLVTEQISQSVSIRPLSEGDLLEAKAILRLAFATQFRMPPGYILDRSRLRHRPLADRPLAGFWCVD